MRHDSIDASYSASRQDATCKAQDFFIVLRPGFPQAFLDARCILAWKWLRNCRINRLRSPICTSPTNNVTTRCNTAAAARAACCLPAISLGLWHNFGGADVFENGRAMVRRAFDLGITHFDLANNYGPPPGSAEANFGRILRLDLKPHRDELIISTKAGYDMWPGPYGDWGSRKYLLASLDQSLKRHGPGVCGHLLLASARPGDARGRDDGRAGSGGAQRQGALCRHFELQRAARPRRRSKFCASWARPA